MEIKLRVWDLKREYYFIPVKFDFENKEDGLPWVHNGSRFVKNVVIELFSLFYDMHGQEIYDGHIIEWVNAPGIDDGLGQVFFNTNRGAWYIENDELNIYDELYNVYDYSQVIGNIHENINLLE